MAEDYYEIEPRKPKREYTNTIGSIITWALIRAAGVIVVTMVLYEHMKWLNYSLWWMVTIASSYGFVIHPMTIQYRVYKEETRNVVTNTLCAKCKHFEPTGVLCSVLDEHVTEEYIPCEGELWEPISFEDEE